MQRDQHVNGGFVARRDRRRRIAVDDAHLAEILHDDEAARRIGVQNLRRREVAVAQAARQRDVGDRILGQMGDGAIGLAVAHRRAVGPRRRVHQDHGLVVEREPLEDARRGVALHALAPRRADAGFVEEGAHQRDALGARRKGAVADIADMAGFGAELRRQRKGDVETAGRQQAGGAVGPFQQHHGAVGQIVEAELGQFRGARQPVQIGMHQREARQLIGLDEGEGRARHFDAVVAGQIADQRAGKGGLAGAEIAGQRHQIAGLERAGDIGHEGGQRRLVRDGHSEACATRGRQQHRDLGRRQRGGFSGRERTCHSRALADNRGDADRAAVQLDEGAHQREA